MTRQLKIYGKIFPVELYFPQHLLHRYIYNIANSVPTIKKFQN